MGSNFFKKVQYGKETTAGTPVAATRLWVGASIPLKTDRKPVYPKEVFGVRADSLRSVVHQYLYQNTLSVEHGAFQHLPFLFGCGIKGGVTAAPVTSGKTDYLWTHTPSLTAANSPDAATIEMGDDVQAWEVEYCQFSRIKISGKVSQGQEASPVSIEADFYGRQLTTTTFTGSLTAPSLEPLNAKMAKLYLDTSWAGVGGTELANALRTFDIEIITGLHPVFNGSAVKTFHRGVEGIISATAVFTVEGGAAANAIFAAQQAQSLVVARLELTGALIPTATEHSLKIDIGGTYEDADPLNSEDRGDNLSTFSLTGKYDTTGAKLLQLATVTDINAY